MEFECPECGRLYPTAGTCPDCYLELTEYKEEEEEPQKPFYPQDEYKKFEEEDELEEEELEEEKFEEV
jgi:hypothetical protein